jgi:predicted MFS family arabinose efflux permease
LRNNFNFGPSKTGDYFAIVGLFIALSQAVLVARVSRKLNDYSVLKFSLFGNAFMMLLYFLVPTTFSFGLYLIIPLFTAFNGLTMANMTSLISRSAEPGQQGQAMGIYSSVQSLAQVPASVLVGYITTSVTSSQPLIVASVCIALGGLVFITMFKPKYVSSSMAATAPSH